MGSRFWQKDEELGLGCVQWEVVVDENNLNVTLNSRQEAWDGG